jgi:hypothetical protein
MEVEVKEEEDEDIDVVSSTTEELLHCWTMSFGQSPRLRGSDFEIFGGSWNRSTEILLTLEAARKNPMMTDWCPEEEVGNCRAEMRPVLRPKMGTPQKIYGIGSPSQRLR